jgi:triacylglycerol esterase/lipase EstA (alpha/beta hydrolase family)
LIVLFLVILAVVAASLALGRVTYEVDSARDTEFLELDGAWVRYNVIGGGPPVVLVHGWLSSSRIWEPLARRLAQRFTVYTLDLVGFGESDKPSSGYGVRNGSRLLYAFCAHFGLTRASVVGHDLGGNMVVKLAADHPDLVGRVVGDRYMEILDFMMEHDLHPGRPEEVLFCIDCHAGLSDRNVLRAQLTYLYGYDKKAAIG